jgi:hypothetical protein
VIISAAPQAAAVGVPTNFTAISISAAVVCLTVGLLLRWRPLRRLNGLIPWLHLVAGIGLAAAFLRTWAHQLAGLGTAIPYIGVAVAVVVAIVLLFIVGYDLYPGHPTNNVTAGAATLLPAFGPEIGGMVGSMLGTALGWIAVAGATALSRLFGV